MAAAVHRGWRWRSPPEWSTKTLFRKLAEAGCNCLENPKLLQLRVDGQPMKIAPGIDSHFYSYLGPFPHTPGGGHPPRPPSITHSCRGCGVTVREA